MSNDGGRTGFLTILHDLADDLSTEGGLDQILRHAVRSAIERLGFADCIILLFDSERNVLVEKAVLGARDAGGGPDRTPIELPMDQGIVGHVARTRQPLRVDDTRADPRYVKDHLDARSELAVPIALGDDLLGVIDSENEEPGYFTDQDEELLTLVATMTAVRLAHLRSLDSLSQMLAKVRSTERNLLQSRNFIREMIDTAPSVLYVLDYREKLMVEGMDRFARFLGFEVEDIESMDHGVYSLLHPEDIAGVEAQESTLHAAHPGAVVPVEARLQHADGRWIWCQINSKVFARDDDGEPAMEIGSVTDISDLKDIQDALRDRELRARGLFENCFDCIVLYDQEGICKYCSPSIERFLGYADHEVVGRNAMEFVHEDDQAETLRFWFELLKSPGGHGVLVQRIRHKNGHLTWIEARLSNRLDDPAVAGIVSNFHDITDRRRAEEHIFRLANYDTLTGLPNRRMMMDTTERRLARVDREERLTLLYIDLDRFKNVNDTLGHDIGDRLLAEATEAMRTCIGDGPLFGRLGGDEFAVLVDDPEYDPGDLASRLVDTLQAPFKVDGYDIRISASIGIAAFPDSAHSSEELFKHADIAMYRAKQQRNRFAFFRQTDARAMEDRVELEHSLQAAIDNGEFYLEYQPRYALSGGRMVAVEALLRWSSGRFGAVSPGEFIPVAEETGQIYRIGEWVMNACCEQAAAWLRSGFDLRVAFNLSAHELQRGDLVEKLADMLYQHALPGSALELEITESAAMLDVELSLRVLEDLADMGVYLSIDDFGTGYSSLSYLQQLPVHCLKIDQSFLPSHEALATGDDRSMVGGIVALARQADLVTVAEGVETEAQLEHIRAMGVAEGQGYLLARPMSADDVESSGRNREALGQR